MFFKILIIVVLCFALTSALPIPGGIGESLPSPVVDTLKPITDQVDRFLLLFERPTEPVFVPRVTVPKCLSLPEVPEIF